MWAAANKQFFCEFIALMSLTKEKPDPFQAKSISDLLSNSLIAGKNADRAGEFSSLIISFHTQDPIAFGYSYPSLFTSSSSSQEPLIASAVIKAATALCIAKSALYSNL